MADGVLLREGPRVHFVVPGGRVRSAAGTGPGLPEELRAELPRPGAAPILCPDPTLAAALAEGGWATRPPSLEELRRARDAVPRPPRREERAFLLAAARDDLARALASPVESLISLAREEERVERALRRELGAAEQFLAGPDSALDEYARAWTGYREVLRRHHAALAALTERSAGRLVPNLAALVGGRVAARLVAAAGGVDPLARMAASRLQLLGARRRPGGDRGPRYGLLYRAERMGDVPPERRGRLARTVAALAVVAARADALTHTSLAERLVARRDRRVSELRRGG